jgi:G3E family GTPase
VHELYDVTDGAPWSSAEPRSTRVVVIGCRLQRRELEEGLQECIA